MLQRRSAGVLGSAGLHSTEQRQRSRSRPNAASSSSRRGRRQLAPPRATSTKPARVDWLAEPHSSSTTSSSSSSASSGGSKAGGVSPPGDAFTVQQPFDKWTSPCGRWLIRPIRREDTRRVADLQAEAFHQPLWEPFNALALHVSRGECLAILQSKLRYSHKTGFICLVAEPVAPGRGGVCGVVELSMQEDRAELSALGRRGFQDTSYAYAACMAVAPRFRRQGVASALLGACERMAGRWQQNWVLLHANRDATGGLATYRKNGYAELAGQPRWRVALQGRERVLLGKASAQFSSAPGAIQSLSTNLLALWQQQQQQPEGAA